MKTLLFISIMTVATIYVLTSFDVIGFGAQQKYQIRQDRVIYNTDIYTEKDNCLFFDEVKLCGNYSITKMK